MLFGSSGQLVAVVSGDRELARDGGVGEVVMVTPCGFVFPSRLAEELLHCPDLHTQMLACMLLFVNIQDDKTGF